MAGSKTDNHNATSNPSSRRPAPAAFQIGVDFNFIDDSINDSLEVTWEFACSTNQSTLTALPRVLSSTNVVVQPRRSFRLCFVTDAGERGCTRIKWSGIMIGACEEAIALRLGIWQLTQFSCGFTGHCLILTARKGAGRWADAGEV